LKLPIAYALTRLHLDTGPTVAWARTSGILNRVDVPAD
jgi:hypothetical protein